MTNVGLYAVHGFLSASQLRHPSFFNCPENETKNMCEGVEVVLDDLHTLHVPTRIGQHYNFIRLVGNGSNSAVVLVEQIPTKKLYAAKVVSRAMLENENTLIRFEQELRILQSLKHPNIVQLRDVVYNPDNIYLIMDYCSNGELFLHIIENGELAECDARRLFRQIVEAIAYIHKRNIAHRDLKPENILLDENMNAKLCDFGLCHIANDKELLLTPCGSPFYAPPEIINNAKYDGKKADIWSLGIVLFTMLTGSLPWTEVEPVHKLYEQIANAKIKIPMCFPVSLRILIKEMTSIIPSHRPTCEQILVSPWVNDGASPNGIKPTYSSVNGRIIRKPGRGTARCSIQPSKSQPSDIIINGFKTQIKGRKKNNNDNSVENNPIMHDSFLVQSTKQSANNKRVDVSKKKSNGLEIDSLKRIVPSSGRRPKKTNFL